LTVGLSVDVAGATPNDLGASAHASKATATEKTSPKRKSPEKKPAKKTPAATKKCTTTKKGKKVVRHCVTVKKAPAKTPSSTAPAKPVTTPVPAAPAAVAPGPSSVPSATPSPTPLPTPTATPTPTPDPGAVTTGPTVTPQVDESRAVEEEAYPDADAELQTTGADGTVYTLTIPEGALVGEEAVTMAPLTAVAGSPVGFRAGVSLEPSGLRFLKPALLRIHPPVPLTDAQIADETPASFNGDGTDLGPTELLVSGDPDGTGAPARDEVLPVLHFSGYQVSEASPAANAALIASANDEAHRLAGEMQAVLGAERTRQLAGGSSDTSGVLDQLAPLFEQKWQSSVKPILLAAETDDSLADDAISRALGWEREAQLLGLPSTHEAEIVDAMRLILDHRFHKATERCAQGADVRAIRDILASVRAEQLLGIHGDAYGASDISSCVATRLQLKLSGDNTVTAKSSGSFTSQSNDWLQGGLHAATTSGTATGTSGTFDFHDGVFRVTDGTVQLAGGSVQAASSICSATYDGQDHSGDATGSNAFTATIAPEINPAPALADSVFVQSLGVSDASSVTEYLPDPGQPCYADHQIWPRLLGSGVRQGVHAALGGSTTLPAPVPDPVVSYTVSPHFTLSVTKAGS
ncbi:MAG: hypothetical protein REI11_12560, partial [Patulibacter sp.]|nr:hypothetical protein [Patulibacter sp.]